MELGPDLRGQPGSGGGGGCQGGVFAHVVILLQVADKCRSRCRRGGASLSTPFRKDFTSSWAWAAGLSKPLKPAAW